MKSVFLCLAFLVTVATAQTTPSSADKQAVLRLYDDERQAFLRADAKALDNFFADEFMVTNPFNQLVPKHYFIDLVANGTLAFSRFERTIEHMQFYGDMVVVAGKETCGWAGKMPTAGTTSELRFTGVARKVDGKWVEVARHASVIIPMPAVPGSKR
jgi:hypothetical protein